MPIGIRNINVYGQVDIARSSSSLPASLNAATDVNNNGTIARIPFGRDAFGLAFSPSLAVAICNAGQDSNPAAGEDNCAPYLHNEQLISVFTSTTSGGHSLTIGSTPIVMKGIIPQDGSGTGSDFMSKIGMNTTQRNASIAAGAIAYGQEHDASNLAANEFTPMSVSRWIAMKNLASFNRSGTALLGSITTSMVATPVVPAFPVAGTAPSLTPVKAYYDDPIWGRDTYLFVERARVTPGNARYDANLHSLVDPDIQADGFVLNNLVNRETVGSSKAGRVKLLFGLLPALDTNIAFTAPKYAGRK
jgi:hypothetical protein